MKNSSLTVSWQWATSSKGSHLGALPTGDQPRGILCDRDGAYRESSHEGSCEMEACMEWSRWGLVTPHSHLDTCFPNWQLSPDVSCHSMLIVINIFGGAIAQLRCSNVSEIGSTCSFIRLLLKDEDTTMHIQRPWPTVIGQGPFTILAEDFSPFSSWSVGILDLNARCISPLSSPQV